MKCPLVVAVLISCLFSSLRGEIAPSAGEKIHIQMFVPEAAGQVTLGYNIELSAPGFDLLSLFEFSGEDFLGAPLLPTPSGIGLSALLVGRPNFPSSGYIGTTVLTAQEDISPGTIIQFTGGTSIADANSEEDLLNVSRAFITLEDADFVAAIPGDLDLDGDVDFGDFLNFAQNFGKSGPVPSAIPSLILRDTVIVTVRDTVQVTRTVRDTIFLVREEAPDGPTTRARALLGYWRIDVVSDWSDEYHLDTVTNRELKDGELIVTGRHKNGDRVTAGYSSALEEYLLLNHHLFNLDFFFQIVGDRIVGTLYFYLPWETLADAAIYPLLSTSGRIGGFSSGKVVENPEAKIVQRKAAGTQANGVDALIRLRVSEVERMLNSQD